MTFSKSDRARISVHSLIGYCRSAEVLVKCKVEKKELQNWVNGLLEITEEVARKLDVDN